MNPFVHRLAEEYEIKIQNPNLIETALTHRSYVKQFPDQGHSDNERLEFLGDAVLKLVVSSSLYIRYAGAREGELTKLRARLISDSACAQYALSLKLEQDIHLSSSEEKSGGRLRHSILGNAFEALLGAIYLDQGLMSCELFFNRVLNQTPQVEMSADLDYKTQLQEWVQKHQLPLPIYELVRTVGPDHQKVFEIQVKVDLADGEEVGERGAGATKKEAEQHAAQKCLERIRNAH